MPQGGGCKHYNANPTGKNKIPPGISNMMQMKRQKTNNRWAARQTGGGEMDRGPQVSFKIDNKDNFNDDKEEQSAGTQRFSFQRKNTRHTSKVVVDLGADLPMACPAAWWLL